MSMVALLERAADAAVFHLPGRVVTAGGFAADAHRLAARLPDASHALNLCEDRYAFAVGFAAALLRGQVSVLGNHRSADWVAAVTAAHPGLHAITDGNGAVLAGTVVPPPGTATAEIPWIPGEQLAALVYTSGSTGEPTVHRKRWAALASRSRAAAAAFGLDGPAAIIGMVPPQHMYGFETTVLLPLHAPATSWCGPAFYPADIRAALAASDAPRWLVTTPLQLRTLLQADPGLPPLAGVISATAPLATAMAAAAEQRWLTTVHEIFGATEVGSIAHRRTADGEWWTPYVDVSLQQGADGECLVAAAGAEPTLLADQVAPVADGRFRLLGRRTDVVKLGGRRASLAALNRTLLEVDGVEDGVFVPPGDAEPGAFARMTAVVVAPGRAAEAIIAALRGRIDPIFLPRRIVHVDRLPRNEIGKLPHAALAALR